MTFPTEGAEKLLDLIYDAATDQELWRDVLIEIADRTNSQGGILIGQSILGGQVFFDYNGRLDEDCNRAFRERHIQNAWSLGMVPQPTGRIVFSDEIVPLSSLERSLFYEEVLRPQDVAHNAMSALAKKKDFTAAFNICRSVRQGPFGEDERRLLEWLMPHLHRSLVLGFRIDAYRKLQRAEYHVLDQLAMGVILLDRNKRITYENAAARRQGSDDGALDLRLAAVSARAIPYAALLEERISRALMGMPISAVSVPRPDGQLLTILVSPVRSRDLDRFGALDLSDAAVLLFLIDPTNRNGIPVDWIIDAFRLTHAEARVAIAVSTGSTIAETAAHLGLSPNTIKTHLRHVFAKTGTSRQAELARLMTSIGLIKAPRTE